MQQFESRTVERGLAFKPSTLRYMAGRLELPEHGQRGKARMWSLAEVVLLLAAQRLADRRGFTPAVAVEFAKAMTDEIPHLLADEKAKAWLFARPDPEGGYFYTITHDAREGLSLADPDDMPIIISIHGYVTEAMTLAFVAEAKGSPRNG